MPESEYQEINALRSTFLRSMLRTTPQQAFADALEGGEDSEAKRFGRLLHMVVLEPKRAERMLVDLPEFVGKGSRALKDAFMHMNLDRIPVKPKVRAQLYAMRDAVLSHPIAGPMFSCDGRNEVSAVWDDPLGFTAKSRIDRIYDLRPSLAIAELKSTRNAQEDFFRYDCEQYGYYVEAAMQLRALDICTGEHLRPYHFVAVEKVEPYRVQVYYLRRSDRALGAQKMLRGMEVYAECLRTGEWPDAPIFGDPMEGVA